MRPKNTDLPPGGTPDGRKSRRRREAVTGVLLFGLLQLCCAAGLWALGLIPGLPGWCRAMFWILAAGCVILIIPALIMLKKRFEEIEGGELDAAGQY